MLYFILFLVVLGILAVVVQYGLLTLTFNKLGLSPGSAFTLLFISLIGSLINFPLFSILADRESIQSELMPLPAENFTGRTVIAVNLGGCIIPLLFSAYLLVHAALPVGAVLTGVILVTLISYVSSRPIAGVGIGMPILIAPLTAATVAILIGGEERAALAYISGTVGVLIGADLLRLRHVRNFGVPFASIGGAGTFDGIYLSGLIAVLLT